MVSNPKDLDRLLAPEFIEGLDELSLAELRERRRQCGEIEVGLSYIRRMAQGRLDLVHADLERRQTGAPFPDDLVDQLSAALAHNVTSPGSGRMAAVMVPDMEDRQLTAELDTVVSPDRLVNLTSLEDSEVKSLAEALIKFEAGVSAQRRALHERIDAIQGEVVRRYQSGEANIDNLLS